MTFRTARTSCTVPVAPRTKQFDSGYHHRVSEARSDGGSGSGARSASSGIKRVVVSQVKLRDHI